MSFRSLPLSLSTSDEFRALSPEAKGILLTLLLHCNYTGLGRFHAGVLAIFANAAAERLAEILDELEMSGWIITDGLAVFVVDVLSWQVVRSTNAKHRLGVQRLIGDVHSTKLLSAFAERYPDWVADPSEAHVEVSSVPSGWDRDPIANGPSMSPDSHGPSLRRASRRDADQEKAAVSESEEKVQNDSRQHSSAPMTAIEYAHTLAKDIEAVQLGGGPSSGSTRVKADVKAAATLLAAAIPLSFARTIAAEVARTFRPAPESPRIASTHYVSASVIEAWRRRNDEREPGSSTRRSPNGRGVASDEHDRAMNLDPRVQQAVNDEVQRMNTTEPGSGDAWLASMKALARPQGRWVIPFAFEWLKHRGAAACSASTNDGDAH